MPLKLSTKNLRIFIVIVVTRLFFFKITSSNEFERLNFKRFEYEHEQIQTHLIKTNESQLLSDFIETRECVNLTNVH